MALQELITEFEIYLNKEVERAYFPLPLYRGDNRDLEAIKEAEGFLPKNNAKEKPVIRTLLYHCAENSYGGPFISTTEDQAVASGFGRYVYRINAGMGVVSAENWTKLANYRNLLMHEKSVANADTDVTILNRASRYIELLNAAIQYNNAQREQLVIKKIPMQVIKLLN